MVGGGHAGCEAAAAAARYGAPTLLITLRPEDLGAMSCNPAIGGLGKGHLVREIDALDGLMARAIDRAGIQFRMLNRAKGPAVQGPRAQADRALYHQAMAALLAEQPGLTVVTDAVEALLDDGQGRIVGVRTRDRGAVRAAAVVLTTGTFLRGRLHRGPESRPGGREGDPPADTLAADLTRRGLVAQRLKTGTPPRLDGRTLHWDALTPQPGDTPPVPFSFLTRTITTPQIACAITRTTPATHALVREALPQSALYGGLIAGTGPRYCPSLEDKIVRFADRDSHQIFLEPEGLSTPQVYPNGLSNSLPPAVQAALVNSLPGLEDARILVPGYAIEYDAADPRGLRPSLECRAWPGLYLAGQINGTTGYEEAGAQGVVAGLNAARAAGGAAPVTPDRADGYVGVMIDDLLTHGAPEPYRMFTSRAEYRLRLRADNADQRLTPWGLAAGVVGPERAQAWAAKAERLATARARCLAASAPPAALADAGIPVNRDGRRRTALDLLGYPEVDWARVVRVFPDLGNLDPEMAAQMTIEGRYAGYLARQERDIAAMRRDESLALPEDLDYGAVDGLTVELREKLTASRPPTLGSASRIPGMTPAALSILLRYARRG